jgi:hypothetical protein
MAKDPKKLQIGLDPVMHKYLEDLIKIGFFGNDKTKVARRLIEDGIRKAIAENLIKVRTLDE